MRAIRRVVPGSVEGGLGVVNLIGVAARLRCFQLGLSVVGGGVCLVEEIPSRL